MAYGDIGGAVTELIVTCKGPIRGEAISKGAAVVLTGGYEVGLSLTPERRIFGQAMVDAAEFAEAIPIKVRGICIFAYIGPPPTVDGEHGVVASCFKPGLVVMPGVGYGCGINLRVDTEKSEVHVLL